MDIILNIIISWSICLAMPLIIRYVVIRKPLSKRNAIIVAAVNFGITILIPIAITGKSNTSIWTFIMIYASYSILEYNGKVAKTTTEDTDNVKEIDS